MKNSIKISLLLLLAGSPLFGHQKWNLSSWNRVSFSKKMRSSTNWLRNPENRKNVALGSTVALTSLALLYYRGSIFHFIHNKYQGVSSQKSRARIRDNSCHKCGQYSTYKCRTGYYVCRNCYNAGKLRCKRLCPTCFCKCDAWQEQNDLNVDSFGKNYVLLEDDNEETSRCSCRWWQSLISNLTEKLRTLRISDRRVPISK